MPSFDLTKKLPSANIDKDLLLEIDECVQSKFDELVASIDSRHPVESEFILTDMEGVETFDRVSDYRAKTFSGGLRTIEICKKAYGPNDVFARVRVRFSTQRLFADVEVRARMEGGRQFAVGVADEVMTSVARCKNFNWIFDPRDGISFLTLAGAAVNIPIGLAALAQGSKLGLVVLAAGTFALILGVMSALIPYHSFDSQENRYKTRVLLFFGGFFITALLTYMMTPVGAWIRAVIQA